jgi:hypothetical protein
MGADGGIRVVKIKSIRENWKHFLQNLLDDENLKNNAKKLPKTLSWNVTDEKLVEYLQVFKYRDCPCLLGEYLVCAEGDYVANEMNALSTIIKLLLEDSYYIETWT